MRSVLLVFTILAVLGILVGAAFLATYEGDVLRDPHPDDRDAELPPGAVQPEDIAELRFDLAFRGYRMAEVDRVLHRLSDELAARDTRIAELEQALVEAPAPLDPVHEEPEQPQAVAEVPVPPAPAVPLAEPEQPQQEHPEAPEVYEPLEPPAVAPAAISGPLTATTWFTEPTPVEPQPEPAPVQEHRHFSLDSDDEAFRFPELTPPPPAEPDSSGEQAPSA